MCCVRDFVRDFALVGIDPKMCRPVSTCVDPFRCCQAAVRLDGVDFVEEKQGVHLYFRHFFSFHGDVSERQRTGMVFFS